MRRHVKFPNLDKLEYLHFSKVQTRKEKKKKTKPKLKTHRDSKIHLHSFCF